MSRCRRLLAGLAALTVLAGCTFAVGNAAVPACDRNGDQEQRMACSGR